MIKFQLGLLGISLALGCGGPALRSAAPRPNVLFILTDDQRWDCIGLAAASRVRTPNIDRLGREGVYFPNAFCTTSLCSPSRASILSGLYAHAHGVSNNFTEYPDSMATWPRALQGAGWETAYIGKYHMGEDNDDPRPGFDHFVTHRGQGKYWDTEFRANGGERKTIPGYYTTVVTDLAEQWIRSRKGERPWAMILGHKAPHSFYTPEPKYEKAFDGVEVRYPETAFHLEKNSDWYAERLDTCTASTGRSSNSARSGRTGAPKASRPLPRWPAPTGPRSSRSTTAWVACSGSSRNGASSTARSSSSRRTTGSSKASMGWSTSGPCTSPASGCRCSRATRD
jgi:N-acetylglucosamine-6-sulfatase